MALPLWLRCRRLASGFSRKPLKLAETSAEGSLQDVKTMAALGVFQRPKFWRSRSFERSRGARRALIYLRRMALEGMVSKRLDKPYRSGRSGDWIKTKNPDSPAVQRFR